MLNETLWPLIVMLALALIYRLLDRLLKLHEPNGEVDAFSTTVADLKKRISLIEIRLGLSKER